MADVVERPELTAGLGATRWVDRPAPELPLIHLRGIPLHALSEPAAIQYILDALEAGRGGWVITVNLDHLRRLVRDESLRQLYAGADLRVADGMPLVWAAKLQGTPLPQRVAGSSLISTLSARAAQRGRSVYLLGGEPGSAEEAARVLQERYPGTRIAGTSCPEMGFEKDPIKLGALIEEVCGADPDIVYVGLGSPKQERLIEQLRARLPRAWWLGVGISFSFLSGQVRRAPGWMQRMGLEWLHRLWQEPGRLARRYLVDGLPFAAWLLVGAGLSGGWGRWREKASKPANGRAWQARG